MLCKLVTFLWFINAGVFIHVEYFCAKVYSVYKGSNV